MAMYVLRVLCGENRPKSENWANLTPRSSATIRLTEKSTDPGNSLALGLQHGVNSISLQCIPWPVACSEWGTCLTDFRFWGKMTAKVKIFLMSYRIPRRDTEIRFVTKFGKSSWKVVWFATQEKQPSLRRTRPSPHFSQNGPMAFFPKWADGAQNYLNVVTPFYFYLQPWSLSTIMLLWHLFLIIIINNNNNPLICPHRPNLVCIGCVLPDLFRKDWFFSPKSHYNNFYRLSVYNKVLASKSEWTRKVEYVYNFWSVLMLPTIARCQMRTDCL